MSDNTESSTNFYRIVSLIVDVGTYTLRYLFYSKVPKEKVAIFFAEPSTMSEFGFLKKKVLTKVQYTKVADNPDPDTYDISLLTTLLTNETLCQISPPIKGWRARPVDPSDLSLGADLIRLRVIRNEIIGHRANAQIDVDEFNELWYTVVSVLVRIAGQVGPKEKASILQKLKEVEKKLIVLTVGKDGRSVQTLADWHKEDSEKLQAELTDMQSKLKALTLQGPKAADENKLLCIEEEIKALREEAYSMATKDDIKKVEDEIKEVKALLTDSDKNVDKLVEQICASIVLKDNSTLILTGNVSGPQSINHIKHGGTVQAPLADKETVPISDQASPGTVQAPLADKETVPISDQASPGPNPVNE